MKIRFSESDIQQIEALGIERSRVLQQIEIFRRSGRPTRLDRPCTLGDGVLEISPSDAEKYIQLHAAAARSGRFMKFVPASGAASRMFQSLLQIFYLPQFLEKDELYRRVNQGVAIACDFIRFLDGLDRFAFTEDLRKTLDQDGLTIDDLIEKGKFRLLLEYLLTKRGLNYGHLPKALLKFHAYGDESRTALEEQLIESIFYLDGGGGKCRLHFTVPDEHASVFKTHLEKAGRRLGLRYQTGFDIDFSFQKPSTNTIAVDMSGHPFRDRFGRLHFRPSGHGALLENLNDLGGDLIYIKNIDNIAPDRLKEPVCRWKRVLGGCLVHIQEEVHSILRRLKMDKAARGSGNAEGETDRKTLEEAEAFSSKSLGLDFPENFREWPVENRRAFLVEMLDRPIRICGVVPNAGEPGGAPFWVRDEEGRASLQIVEKAQVDFGLEGQNEIWNSSTHFNPVDIVCSTRDFEGNPFDLRKYVDQDAVLISKKSKDGKDLLALELPGLWNGSMANWISLFVQVPPYTFSPVKSVYDLLRPEHQAEPEEESVRRRIGELGGRCP